MTGIPIKRVNLLKIFEIHDAINMKVCYLFYPQTFKQWRNFLSVQPCACFYSMLPWTSPMRLRKVVLHISLLLSYISPPFMSMLIYFQSYNQKLSFSCRRPIMNLVVSHILDTIFLLINLILCMVVFTDGEDTKDPRRAPVHTCVEYIYQPECQPSYCSQYCHEAQRTAIKSRCDLKKGLCLCYFQCVYPPN